MQNKKLTSPLLVPSKTISFFHEYDSHDEFLKELENGKVDLYLKFVNGITFKVIFGNPYKSAELRSVFKNIMEDNYPVQGSSIQFDKTGKKIILNLSLGIPQKDVVLDDAVAVGVKLGMLTPVVCSLNTSEKIRLDIGDTQSLYEMRTKIQAHLRRTQSSVKYSNGGHGRKKKLKPLERYTQYEKNVAITYNHKISHDVVDFALKHKAKTIYLEDIDKEQLNTLALRNWSYAQQQQFIIYKAKKYGIQVVILPVPDAVCMTCGELITITRGEGVCQNPECKACGKIIDADFQISRQLACAGDRTKNLQ